MNIKIATYNILTPPAAVEFSTTAGLNEKGLEVLKTDKEYSPYGGSSILYQAYKNGEWEQYSNWSDRQLTLIENLEASKAGVVLLQEVTPGTILDLQKALQKANSAYQVAIAACHDENRESKDLYGNAILINANQFKLIHQEVVHIKVSEEQFDRIGVIAQVKDKTTQKVITCMSVHLLGYWGNQPDQEKFVASLKNGLDELKLYQTALDHFQKNHPSDYLVVGGDFNEDPIYDGGNAGHISQGNLRQPGYMASLPQQLKRTGLLEMAGFKRALRREVTEVEKGREIDHIYVKNVSNESFELERDARVYPSASDHSLVGVTINENEQIN